jgi:hypothetical protein
MTEATIIPFPTPSASHSAQSLARRTPLPAAVHDDRLAAALHNLQEALAEQAQAVAEWRFAMAELGVGIAALGHSVASYGGSIANLDERLALLRQHATDLQATADRL